MLADVSVGSVASVWPSVEDFRSSPVNRHGQGRSAMSQRCQYRKSTKSFDHFVGACEQRRQGGNAECFGGLHVDYKLECRDLLHR